MPCGTRVCFPDLPGPAPASGRRSPPSWRCCSSAGSRRTSRAVGQVRFARSRRSPSRPTPPRGIGWRARLAGLLAAGGTGSAVPGGGLGTGIDRSCSGSRHRDGGGPAPSRCSPRCWCSSEYASSARSPAAVRRQRIPRAGEREVPGKAGRFGGDPAGSDGRGCGHDAVPAVHVGSRVEGTARRSGHGGARRRRRTRPGSRPTSSTSWRRSLRARWSVSRTPTCTPTSSSTPTPPRPWWATRSTACWTWGSARALSNAEQGEVALSEDAAAGLDAKLGEPVDLRLGDGSCTSRRWSPSTRSRWASRTSSCRGPRWTAT